jgi:iduronate 2-sulfatase
MIGLMVGGVIESQALEVPQPMLPFESDHGDTMGRHHFMSKDFAFYEPAMRIPMIIRCPNRKGGMMNSDPVSGIDVFPTLCDLIGLPKPSHIPGQSLVRRWEGEESDPERAIFSAQGTPGKDRAVMLRTPPLQVHTLRRRRQRVVRFGA